MEVIYNNSDGVKHVYIGTQLIYKFNLEACKFFRTHTD